MNATGQVEPSGPNPALVSALLTEHYTLQSARAATIIEANGRAMLFLSAVSGATVALALVAHLERVSGTFFTFALSVLPALRWLGVTSYSRLADLAVHDAYYARAIGRIRAFYLTIEPAAAQYWLQPAGDDAHAVMRPSRASALAVAPPGAHRHVGRRRRRRHRWRLPRPARLGGTALTTPVLAAGAVVVAVVVVAALLVDKEQQWRRFEGSMQYLFLPDGTPRCP